jgi:hypothetical protein
MSFALPRYSLGLYSKRERHFFPSLLILNKTAKLNASNHVKAKLLVFSEVASTPAEFVLIWVQPQSITVACALRQDLDPSQAALSFYLTLTHGAILPMPI